MTSKHLLGLLATLTVVFAAVTILFLWVRSARRPDPLPGAPGADVVLISIDTLRADHLEPYGYDRPTSPELVRFRQDAVLFEEAIAHAPSTLPSHASILTSLLPQHHHASFSARTPLPDEVVTVTEALAAAGYATFSSNGGGQIDETFGLAQGFEVYRSEKDALFGDVIDDALAWLDEERPDRFFLFLHTYQTHHPYDPSREHLAEFVETYEGWVPHRVSGPLLEAINKGERPIDEADLNYIVSSYDAEIRDMDFDLGTLVRELEARGLYDDALIVFTSDHGEEFGEHGWVGWHAHTLYDELLRVPLLVKFPEGRWAGRSVGRQARSIDIAPTILAHLEIDLPDTFTGVDLRSLLEPGWPAPGAAAAVSVKDHDVPKPDTSIRDGRWKLYLQGSRGRLFDLEEDPWETRDVAEGHGWRVGRLERALERILQGGPEIEPATATDVDAETLDQLRALGYVD